MKRMLNQNLIDFLNSLGDSLKYESSSNSFEIGTNLEVDGSIISHYNNEALVIIDENNSSLIFSFEQGNALVIKNDNETGIYLDEFGESGELYKVATSNSLKTVFGKSIMKDPEQPEDNNINLYVHYLSIIANNKFYYGVIYSSNNTAASNPQQLATLFKATPDTPLNYITLSNIDTNTVALLKWTGDIWQIQLANDNFVTVTSVTDRVETI